MSDQIGLVSIITLSALTICFLYSSSLVEKDGGLWSTGIGCEDMAMHGTIANAFLNNYTNIKFPTYPIYDGAVLGYPFLADFTATTMMTLGASIGSAFFLTSVWALLGALLGIIALSRRYLSWMQTFFVIFLFLVGGNAGFLFFANDILQGDLAGFRSQDYTNNFNLNLHYHNILIAVLLPMRTSLFGMAIAFPIITMVTSRAKLQGRHTLALGMMLGSLPMINPHSLVAVCVVGIVTIMRSPRIEITRGYRALIISALLMTPQLIWISQQLNHSETPFIRWSNGYMFQSTLGIGAYWALNLGFFWLAAVFGFKKLPGDAKRIVLPLVWIFPLSAVVYFQPNSYDNIKLLCFSHLGGAFLIVNFLKQMSYKKPYLIFQFLLILGSSLSGLLAIAREPNTACLMATDEDRAFSTVVLEHSTEQDLFLTSSKFNHPIAFLAGRQLFLGNHNWLGQHGIRYLQRKDIVRKIYADPLNFTDLLESSGITHIVVGPYERDEFPEIKEASFEPLSKEIIRKNLYTLYVIDRTKL